MNRRTTPTTTIRVESFAEGGTDAPAWGWANVFAAAVPLMERLRVATGAEVDPATLADRLLAETLASDGCVIGPPMTQGLGRGTRGLRRSRHEHTASLLCAGVRGGVGVHRGQIGSRNRRGIGAEAAAVHDAEPASRELR